MKHLAWPFEGFETIASNTIRDHRALKRRLPIRYLRYWFCRRLLTELHERIGRRLRVLEVGVEYGQMLCFMGGRKIESDRFALPDMIAEWDALDVMAHSDSLRRFSYSHYFQTDVELPLDLGGRRYDAVVLLHVLEHLVEPAAAMTRLVQAIDSGGLLLGGSPTMPAWIGRLHQRWLRRIYQYRTYKTPPERHQSVISPSFIRWFAEQAGLDVELLTGTFLMRSTDNPLEDYAPWIRANLMWGALFPSLGGEVLFSLRVPLQPRGAT